MIKMSSLKLGSYLRAMYVKDKQHYRPVTGPISEPKK